ncbi:MAG: 7-cyano-7-deazaguanine synthase QueC [Candidatus Latescibacteria bacterium]|nr:7-cyano-7-deazaguanine synthase QueC [Candidatus Latescibacterota bacterium]
MKPKAVILLSGGVDSATTLAIARRDGFDLYAISFDYGQRHRSELRAARRVADAMGVVRHVLIPFDLRAIGGSALTDDIPVPKGRDEAAMSANIPVTYVPARNTIFLAFALGWAEALGAFDLYMGVNAIDYSGYPDCRPEYIAAFERLAVLATKAGVEGVGRFRVHTPLIRMTKAEIIRTGAALGVDYSLTHSCYDPTPDGLACGQCDSCLLRQKGFRSAGLSDPTRYAERLS